MDAVPPELKEAIKLSDSLQDLNFNFHRLCYLLLPLAGKSKQAQEQFQSFNLAAP
jgi:hypothetical protein